MWRDIKLLNTDKIRARRPVLGYHDGMPILEALPGETPGIKRNYLETNMTKEAEPEYVEGYRFVEH